LPTAANGMCGTTKKHIHQADFFGAITESKVNNDLDAKRRS
jgi:hypothetical protein